MHSLESYIQILGINSNASVEEIKRAYRTKAMLLHPDRNGSSDAHEQFVLLQEAYEYLLDLKSGKTRSKPHISAAEWQAKQREEARERARRYARMRYEEYIKTEDYRVNKAIETISDHMKFIFSLSLVIGIPILLFFLFKLLIIRLAIGVILLVISLPITIYVLRDRSKLDFRKFWESLVYVAISKPALIVITSLFNIFVIFDIGFQTLIPLLILPLSYVITIFIAHFLLKWIIKVEDSFKRIFFTYFLAPTLISALFTVNYVFSFNSTLETYHFRIDKQQTSRGSQESSLIILDNGKYNEYLGVRIFFSYEKLRGKRKISYVINEGALGFRVMTDYKLE